MFVGAPLKVMLLDDRLPKPWSVLEPQQYDCPMTGETYIVERGFRTDGSSVPIAIAAVPVIGAILVVRYFGGGVFMGFREGVLHDRLRQDPNIPAILAHRIFREALYANGYPSDLVENYYAALKLFNS